MLFVGVVLFVVVHRKPVFFNTSQTLIGMCAGLLIVRRFAVFIEVLLRFRGIMFILRLSSRNLGNKLLVPFRVLLEDSRILLSRNLRVIIRVLLSRNSRVISRVLLSRNLRVLSRVLQIRVLQK